MSHYKKGICSVCGKEIIADQLWIDPPLKGYKSLDHGCGEENTLITFQIKDFSLED